MNWQLVVGLGGIGLRCLLCAILEHVLLEEPDVGAQGRPSEEQGERAPPGPIP